MERKKMEVKGSKARCLSTLSLPRRFFVHWEAPAGNGIDEEN
ncbi:hypothetical protein OOU_Y34scaffold00071g38 [Pyricularia oryzae Y34]|uniref:Uncharacterized protein n=3 Tax=Pyricularia oryzae TaxID=318829 RepID=A0A4P7N9A2_PYROR|nr:hypothetical protein OOU_Y34scaffold00071g38 [Pyricularia oryzae Y34]QBZ59278.1 hypothetical protein PoMZ_04239 [Pyricularia oryzae]